MAKKSKAGKVLLATLGILLAGGVTATITTGALTDWTFGINDPFNDVRIEDQVFDYDGEAKTLNIFVPDDASYELTITNEEGKTVNECKDIGVYTFTYKVKIDDLTKEYIAKLTIKDSSTIESKIEAKGMRLNKVKSYMDGASAVQEITYTVEPDGCEVQLQVLSINFASDDSSTQDDDSWKSGKNASDYIACSIDEASKTIKITNKNSKPFGSQILVTVQSAISNDVSASITCDFKKKASNLSNDISNLSYGIDAFVFKYDYENDALEAINNDCKIIYTNQIYGSGTNILSGDYLKTDFISLIEESINTSVGTINYVPNFDNYEIRLSLTDTAGILPGQTSLAFVYYETNLEQFKETVINNFFDFYNRYRGLHLDLLGSIQGGGKTDVIENSTLLEDLKHLCNYEQKIPLFQIDKNYLEIEIGNYLTVPYKEVFKNDSDNLLDFYLDLSSN